MRLTHRRGIGPRGILVCLCWLAGAQIAVALHSFEHHADNTGETCQVCLQAERGDDVVADTAGVEQPLRQAANVVSTLPGEVGVVSNSHYQPRAPPSCS